MAVKRFLAVDIGASVLKVGEFVSTGPGNLALINFGYAKMDVDPTAEEDINPVLFSTLQKLMVERQFKAKTVAISVSGQLVLTRFLKLPVADEAKVRQMVRYEAAQNVPFPIEEVVWDFQVISTKSDSELEIVMVAIKSDLIEGFNRTMEQLGLRVEVVDISPLCIYNALLYNYEVEQNDTLLLVDIGARTTNLIFVEPKKIFTRSIPIAGNTITQNVVQEFEIPFPKAEELKLQQGFVGLGGAFEEPELESAAKLCKIIRNVMTRLHAEIARSITFYKTQQHGKAPKRFLLSGGTSITSYMDYFFKEKMEMEIEYFNPFKNVAIKVPSEELEKVVHLMAEVVGLGLRVVTECPIEINLIPPSVSKRRQLLKKVPYFVSSLAGILLIVMSWWLYYWRVTSLNTTHFENVQKEVAVLNEINQKLEKETGFSKKVGYQSSQVQALTSARYYWIEFFQDLNKLVPSGLWITEFNPYNVDKIIAITGVETTSNSYGNHNQASSRSVGKPVLPADSRDSITEFEITGSYLVDHKASAENIFKPLKDFENNLKSSKFIKSEKIIKRSDPDDNDWTATFRMRIVLNTPIPY
jgi:type IV pilus assembly protein PilM